MFKNLKVKNYMQSYDKTIKWSELHVKDKSLVYMQRPLNNTGANDALISSQMLRPASIAGL